MKLMISETVSRPAPWRRAPLRTTVIYIKLVHRTGVPASVRAVASVRASNPVPAIPSHRALRSNGDLADYRWDLERKRELIEKEVMV